MPQILVIEDDPRVRTALVRALSDRGYAVTTQSDGASGLQAAVRDRPDLVLLDLGLPNLDGYEVLRMLRAVSRVRVIVATARDEEAEIVKALDAGADDYLVKPFGGAQLDARIRAVLRRGGDPEPAKTVTVGRLVIDVGGRTATLRDEPLDLSPREFDLLRYLAERAGTVVTKRELLTEVWQLPWARWKDSGGGDKTVDVHLSWLRRKLGESAQEPVYLHTVRTIGVKLEAPQ